MILPALARGEGEAGTVRERTRHQIVGRLGADEETLILPGQVGGGRSRHGQERDFDGSEPHERIRVVTVVPPAERVGVGVAIDIRRLQNAISALPGSAFKDQGKSSGLRAAMLSKLENIETLVANGNYAQAIHQVQILIGRVDGCASPAGTPDNDDWIVDCTEQIQIRDLLELYLSNLSSHVSLPPFSRRAGPGARSPAGSAAPR